MDLSANIAKGVNSLYGDQLRRGFAALRFDDFLEDEFRQVYLQDNFQKSRLVIALSLLVCVVVALLNMSAPAGGSVSMNKFGLSLMAPMLLMTFVASFTGHRFIYQALLAVSALVIGIAGTAIDVQASLAGMSYYFAGQVGWIFMVWSLLGLMFMAAAGLCATISVIYVAWAMWAGLPSQEIFFEGFMLMNINVLGGYSCYKIEHAARRTFLESRILSKLAERDGLTGLYNRRSFDEYMARVWRQSRRENLQLTIMLVDIDHFKPFNDLYGHQAGDDALKQVASVIASAVQRPLDIAARFGGEEFALVLYGPASDFGRTLPERLREQVIELGTKHEGATQNQFLTVSIGVAIVHPDADRSLAGAIQMADEALYQAKADGRNRIIVKESGTSDFETGRFRVRRAS